MSGEIPGPKPAEIAPPKDVEQQTPIVVLYRGDKEGQATNPFMRAIVTGLRQHGLNIIDNPVSPEVYEAEIVPFLGGQILGNLGNQESALKQKAVAAVGKIDEGSIVITDETLEKIGEIISEDSLQAHESLDMEMNNVDDIKRLIEPTVEVIRKKGRMPIILPYELGRHLFYNVFKISSEDREMLEESFNKSHTEREVARLEDSIGDPDGKSFIEAISENLNIPVLGSKFYVGSKFQSPVATLFEELQDKGIPVEKAVLLVDHHETYLNESQIKAAGLDQVDQVLICPCCIVAGSKARGGYIAGAEAKGFKFFKVGSSGENKMDGVLAKLVSQIKEREAARQEQQRQVQEAS